VSRGDLVTSLEFVEFAEGAVDGDGGAEFLEFTDELGGNIGLNRGVSGADRHAGSIGRSPGRKRPCGSGDGWERINAPETDGFNRRRRAIA
jgi:hypothetical protein